QSPHGGAVLVDHTDAHLHHGRVRDRGEPVRHHLQVVGQHDVVGAHHHHDRSRDHAQAFAVVAVGAEVLLVLLVRHSAVAGGELTHVAGRLGIRVAVVDHHQAEIPVALREDTVHGLLEVVDVPVVREHHVNGHRGTAVLLITGLCMRSHSIYLR